MSEFNLMIDHAAVVGISMISLARILILSFAELEVMVPHTLSTYLGRAFSTCSMMCSGCFLSTAPGRPNVLGKTSASPRKCGTIAARSSGTNIVLKGPGLGLRRLGRNGSRARAVVEQVLHHLGVRRRRWMMDSLTTKTIRNSERDLGRHGWPARTRPEGPDRRPGCWAQGGPACLPSGSRFCRHHGGGGVAVDD